MNHSKEIYIVGPGSSLNDVDVSLLKDKVIFNFSGDLTWFNDNIIYPTYWTFLDPNSTLYILERIKQERYNTNWLSGLKENSFLLYNDFQGSNDFYDVGYSTSRGRKWNSREFGDRILPLLQEKFAKTFIVPTTVRLNEYGPLEEVTTKAPLVKHERGTNTDKLTCFIIPMALHLLPELKKINCIGFGDFDTPRISNGTMLGYKGYKLSYDRMKEKTITLLKNRKVSIVFFNKSSYFIELEEGTK